MGTAPPPPQVSPDGKFYWDGQRWVPMPQAAPPLQTSGPPASQVQRFPDYPQAQRPTAPTSHRGRNVALGCAGLIVLVVVIGVIASNGSHNNQPTLNWTVDGRALTQSTVGGSDAVQLTVTNNGSAASNFIIYLNAKDDWFKHHVITDPGGCSINKNLERLDCGPLAAGESKTINITGSPKDAGNFDFEADPADEEGSNLLYPDKGALTWSEAVTS